MFDHATALSMDSFMLLIRVS